MREGDRRYNFALTTREMVWYSQGHHLGREDFLAGPTVVNSSDVVFFRASGCRFERAGGLNVCARGVLGGVGAADIA